MQLKLNFNNNIDIYSLENFIIHSGNEDIFNFITSSSLLDNNIFLLTGKIGTGKTYLCKIWNKLKNAIFLDKNILINKSYDDIEYNKKYILEDIENFNFSNQNDLFNINEENLLFLINTIVEKKSILLMTSEKCVNEFDFKLKDLKSRFKNIYNFYIKNIDNDIKYQILFKIITDKQLNIETNILKEVSKKIDGDYNTIINFIDKLENLFLNDKTKIINNNIINKLLDL